MPLRHELARAVALATGGGGGEPRRRDPIAALAWLPAVGLATGLLAAGAASVAGRVGPVAAALAGVAVLVALDGRVRPGRRAWLVAAVVEVGAASRMTPGARTPALLVAPMLARWACVVQCYGGTARPGADGLAALVGRARFREFAVASVTALGAVLVLLDAVGLAVAVASALVTVGVRTAVYRSGRGFGDGAMHATSALVETGVLVLLALIGGLLAR